VLDYYGIETTLVKQDYSGKKKSKLKVRDHSANPTTDHSRMSEVRDQSLSADARDRPTTKSESTSFNFAATMTALLPQKKGSSTSIQQSKSEDGLFVAEQTSLDYMQVETMDYMNLKNLLVSKRELYSTWKNMICVIGKIHLITDPNIHYEVVQTVIGVWDILERLRVTQSCEAKTEPSAIDFIGIVFKAAGMNL
jgi:hypothetical protein